VPERVNILYLCTGNSCRSQMAEGWPLSDPAQASGIDEEFLREFQATRDEVERRVRDLLARLVEGVDD
jgi:protein-tyrosine-phosphatase